MSEKRFIWKCDDENCQIYDTKKKKVYFNVEVVDLLNEQQTTISALKEKNEQLRKQIQNYEVDYNDKCLFEEDIIVLENLLTNIGVKWVDDDE